MEHIGIDLGSRDSQVCVRDDAGAILEEARCTTTGLGCCGSVGEPHSDQRDHLSRRAVPDD